MARPDFDSVFKAASEYIRRIPNGGPLRVVLSDENVDEESLKFAIDLAEDEHDSDGEWIARGLLQLPVDQRERLVHMLWSN